MRPRVAFFRPDDERTKEATTLLRTLGAEPVSDPLLDILPTGKQPRTDAEYLIFTSKTGVELVDGTRLLESEASICAIGDRTAYALNQAGVSVDIVPDEFTSKGLVRTLADDVDGTRIEIARSDHGSQELISGLGDAGAYVHETVLYDLIRPVSSGYSTEQLVQGELDAVLFTSSLTVEHFLDAAEEREIARAVRDALDRVIVGVIGPPTHETANAFDISVDVVATQATFEILSRDVLSVLQTE